MIITDRTVGMADERIHEIVCFLLRYETIKDDKNIETVSGMRLFDTIP